MTTIDQTRRTAARVAGSTYLYLLVSAGFAEFFVRAPLVATDHAAQTATNVVGSERLFRIGVAVDLLAAPANVVLAVALFVLLRPVNRNLAMVAALWRVGEATILGVITIASFVVLHLLSGADYLEAFQTDQLHALAALSIDTHMSAYSIGLVYFSLGSTVFSYLLFRSGYIPGPLAIWGVFSSLLLLASIFAITVFPSLENIALPGVYLPIGIYEATLGLWLLFKALPLTAPPGSPGEADVSAPLALPATK